MGSLLTPQGLGGGPPRTPVARPRRRAALPPALPAARRGAHGTAAALVNAELMCSWPIYLRRVDMPRPILVRMADFLVIVCIFLFTVAMLGMVWALERV